MMLVALAYSPRIQATDFRVMYHFKFASWFSIDKRSRFRIGGTMDATENKTGWPTHIWIVIAIAFATLVSGFYGNYLGYQQWQHPHVAQSAAPSVDPPSTDHPRGPTVSILPFAVMSVSSLGSLTLLLMIVWRGFPKVVKEAAVASKPVLSPVELRTYHAVKGAFDFISWPQKLTLRWVYQQPGINLGVFSERHEDLWVRPRST
jgi:hypothetical protein